MRKTLAWLVSSAVIALIFMSGMFWLFYTLPVIFFLLATVYYLVKSTWQRVRSPRR
ncbi:hypothetical protein [Alicyclobacillus ferrooxydans]|uniref:hypothetical protein n=1 Tax=Alicyclobacillus ferrooxydans TaxID=471514 RepID=UPI0012EEA0CF|nr:hypothetical protein [Alicyclobacillus ferrooxydans]